MGKLELYVKKPNGRYEPYKEPEVSEEYKQVYRKISKSKYEPCGALYPHDDHLTEGVWVVSRARRCKRITSANYLKGLFGVDKVSSLESINIAQLGTLSKVVDDAYYNEYVTGKDAYEVFCKRVGLIVQKLMEG